MTDLSEALEAYRQYPLDDGDVVLLMPEDAVCLEICDVPHDAPDLAEHVAGVVRGVSAPTLVLAVARRGGRLQPRDLLLWTDLCEALSGSPTELLPLQVLPAAA